MPEPDLIRGRSSDDLALLLQIAAENVRQGNYELAIAQIEQFESRVERLQAEIATLRAFIDRGEYAEDVLSDSAVRRLRQALADVEMALEADQLPTARRILTRTLDA
jgi:predicted transcriptional regulator